MRYLDPKKLLKEKLLKVSLEELPKDQTEAKPLVNDINYGLANVEDHKFLPYDSGSHDYSNIKNLSFIYQLAIGVNFQHNPPPISFTALPYRELNPAESYESKNSLNADYSKDTDVEPLGNFNPITEESGKW